LLSADGCAWGAAGPIGGREIHAPEMRGRREEFDADALAFVGKVADKNYSAFLLFFGDRIDQQDVGAHFEFGLHVEQGTVSVDDDGLAILAELAAGGGLARGAHGNAREDACAAASGRAGRYSLHKPIVHLVAVRVNCTFPGRCLKCLAAPRASAYYGHFRQTVGVRAANRLGRHLSLLGCGLLP